MATRYDVSAVSPQGGYVAKQCPVRAQWDTIRPCEPLPASAMLGHLFARGVAFEARVVDTLLSLHSDACVVPNPDHGERAEREEATCAAITAAAPLIFGGRLPADSVAKRVGEPDLLVASARSGYRAVDIKHHRALDTRKEPSALDGKPADVGPALCSALSAPWLETAAADPASVPRRLRGDLLQLAHYQRMLEAAGMAAPDGRLGGIIGVDETVVWHDLDEPVWRTPSSSGSGRVKLRSTMEVYDFEFDFRLDVVAVAERSTADPSVTPLLVPVKIGECAQCPWWSACEPILESGTGDVSLLPGIGWREWRVHRDHGVTDRAALAALDYRTAKLVASGVNLHLVMRALNVLADEVPVAEVLGPTRRAQADRLIAAGVVVLGDARGLCPRTASYCDEPMRDLPEQIDLARAALGDHCAYRRRGVAPVRVPRGDVEIDIDVENTQDGVYLWGALVTARSDARGVPAGSGYRAFYTWEPMSEQVEAGLFAEFWDWFSAQRAATDAAGLRFRAYCYNAAAENSQFRRIAARIGLADEIASFTRSDQWVDMYRVFSRQMITGHATGLKQVAPLAGFCWEVANPGGDESIVRYDAAAAGDDQARDWLIAYNRNDTQATFALREWLDHSASDCPPIEEARYGQAAQGT